MTLPVTLTLVPAMFVEVAGLPHGARRGRHKDVRVGDGVRGPIGGGRTLKKGRRKVSSAVLSVPGGAVARGKPLVDMLTTM